MKASAQRPECKQVFCDHNIELLPRIQVGDTINNSHLGSWVFSQGLASEHVSQTAKCRAVLARCRAGLARCSGIEKLSIIIVLHLMKTGIESKCNLEEGCSNVFLSVARYASELFPQLVPVLSEMSVQLDNIEWAANVKLSDSRLVSYFQFPLSKDHLNGWSKVAPKYAICHLLDRVQNLLLMIRNEVWSLMRVVCNPETVVKLLTFFDSLSLPPCLSLSVCLSVSLSCSMYPLAALHFSSQFAALLTLKESLACCPIPIK